MSKKKYVWIRSVGDVRAEVFGRTMEMIAKSKKSELDGVRPDEVVAVARDPGNPLHKAFEWDNKVAGEKYRVGQAANMIRSIRIYNLDSPDTKKVAFVSVKNDEGKASFIPRTVADAHEETRDQMLRDARGGLRGWLRRYADLNGGAEGIVAIVRSALDQFEALLAEEQKPAEEVAA